LPTKAALRNRVTSRVLDGHRASMDPAQRNAHPSDHHRQRIGAGEHPAVRYRDPRADIESERAQPLAFLVNQL